MIKHYRRDEQRQFLTSPTKYLKRPTWH